MKTLALALAIALTTIACSSDDDDGGTGSAGPVRLEAVALESGTFDSCDVVGEVVNLEDDRFCDVFIAHLAFDSEDFVIGDSFVGIENLAPGERATFEATLLDDGNGLVSCDEIDRFELDELEAICG